MRSSRRGGDDRHWMTDWVSTKQATELLGVGSTTVKRWADEGVLSYYRTAGGHRRFRLSAIEALAEDTAAQQPASAGCKVHDWYEILRNGGLDTVLARIHELRDSVGDWFAAAEGLGAAMDHVGTLWSAEGCSIAETHLVTSKLVQGVSAVAAKLPMSAVAAAPCLVVAVPGDRHGVGAFLSQLCLRGAGYEAFVLAGGIPGPQLAQHLPGSGVKLLALSAANWHTDPVMLKQYYGEIVGACRRDGIELILGGRGAWPGEPDYGYRCRSFTDLRAAIDSIDGM